MFFIHQPGQPILVGNGFDPWQVIHFLMRFESGKELFG